MYTCLSSIHLLVYFFNVRQNRKNTISQALILMDMVPCRIIHKQVCRYRSYLVLTVHCDTSNCKNMDGNGYIILNFWPLRCHGP